MRQGCYTNMIYCFAVLRAENQNRQIMGVFIFNIVWIPGSAWFLYAVRIDTPARSDLEENSLTPASDPEPSANNDAAGRHCQLPSDGVRRRGPTVRRLGRGERRRGIVWRECRRHHSFARV